MNQLTERLSAYYGPLERFVKFRINNLQDAEDIVQDTMLSAIRGADRLRNPESMRAWLFQIAANACRDYYRRKQPEKADLAELENRLTEEVLPETLVEETLLQLREKERLLLKLMYFDVLNQQEIAEALNIPIGTVKSRLHYAKGSFRRAYPYPPREKGANTMKKLPEKLPAYTIIPSKEPVFPVEHRELPGWFIVPKVGEKTQWGMYHHPDCRRTMYATLEVVGNAQIHGLSGVKIQAKEYDPTPSEQVDAQNPVERTIYGQLTDTHSRILAECHRKQGTEELYTFLDGDAFTKNWGFGPDNQGYPIHQAPQGILQKNGNAVEILKKGAWNCDVVGRYTVNIGGKAYDTVLLLDVECYDEGVLLETYLDKNGRTVLWRRFNRDDWAIQHFQQRWSELLPENEQLTVDDMLYVHWYDCITDYIL